MLILRFSAYRVGWIDYLNVRDCDNLYCAVYSFMPFWVVSTLLMFLRTVLARWHHFVSLWHEICMHVHRTKGMVKPNPGSVAIWNQNKRPDFKKIGTSVLSLHFACCTALIFFLLFCLNRKTEILKYISSVFRVKWTLSMKYLILPFPVWLCHCLSLSYTVDTVVVVSLDFVSV